MEKVVITGGSGLIGSHLTKILLMEGYEVVHLTRDKNSKCSVRTYLWDIKNDFIEEGALEKASFVVHLAGTSIGGGRWTDERKRSIINSRVKTIELLFRKVNEKQIKLKGFLSASGISIYGTRTTETIFKEDSCLSDLNYSKDFAADCVVKWEAAADQFSSFCRVVKIRTGIVLSMRGGALPKMYAPIKWGMGAVLGKGNQWLPWIHINDMCRMYLHVLQNNVSGSFNAVAPDHITNRLLIQTLAKVSKHKLWLPNVPEFLLKWMFGEMSGIVLNGSRVSCEKIEKAGFVFKYDKLEPALKNIFDED